MLPKSKYLLVLEIVFYMFVYSNSGEREKLSTTSYILCVRQVANGKLMLKALQFPWKMPFQYFHFWLGENVFATCLEFSSYSVREVICVEAHIPTKFKNLLPSSHMEVIHFALFFICCEKASNNPLIYWMAR